MRNDSTRAQRRTQAACAAHRDRAARQKPTLRIHIALGEHVAVVRDAEFDLAEKRPSSYVVPIGARRDKGLAVRARCADADAIRAAAAGSNRVSGNSNDTEGGSGINR